MLEMRIKMKKQGSIVIALDLEIDRLIEPEFLTNPANHACTFQRGTVAMAGTENQASGS